MIKTTVLFAIVFITCTCSISNKDRNTKDEKTDSNILSAPTNSQENQISLKDDKAIISIEESGSFCNLCSSYKLLVFPNGKIRFEGENFVKNEIAKTQDYVKKKKILDKQISNEQLKKLLREFESIGFFELSDRYIPEVNCPEILSDSPTIHIQYKSEGQSKIIHYYKGCKGNEDLKKLERLTTTFDRLFDTQSWLDKSILANTTNQ